MTLSAVNVRGADAKLEVDRSKAGSVSACVVERATISPEWDGTKHSFALEGATVAEDCGTLKL